MQRIRIIDSHTGGEPTRLVIGGFPDLGHVALLCAPVDPEACAGVIF
ncbi:hydroxyproline-2-epimerase, partial [Pseudomonas aeruginosa]